MKHKKKVTLCLYRPTNHYKADFRQPNFQQAFYGANYQTLRQIKAKYDPFDMFYATTAVGSDEWTESSDGRLCRTQ